MFKPITTFSGFSVDDMEKAKIFYRETLGVKQDEGEMGFGLRLTGGTTAFVYPKSNHQPATFTVLNFVVENIEASMDALKEKGVEFIHYNNDDLPQDDKGILRGISTGMGPDVAWFEDPAGNVLSVLQEAQ